MRTVNQLTSEYILAILLEDLAEFSIQLDQIEFGSELEAARAEACMRMLHLDQSSVGLHQHAMDRSPSRPQELQHFWGQTRSD